MKNSNCTIGNRTRDLPACSTVPQQTASLHALETWVTKCKQLVIEHTLIPQTTLIKTIIFPKYNESDQTLLEHR
jgi:hypothetical protein